HSAIARHHSRRHPEKLFVSSRDARSLAPDSRQVRRYRGGIGAANGMSPPLRAHSGHLPELRRDVVDDVVGVQQITAYPGRDPVQTETLPGFPCDIVIRAGGIA